MKLVAEEEDLSLWMVSTNSYYNKIVRTCLRSRFSSGVILGSFGFLASLAFLSDLGFVTDSTFLLGVPFALGVEDVLSLILGFFTESGRWGV